MIIRVDDTNRVQYEALFTKAYEDLVNAGVIVETQTPGRFTSLEEFFSKITDIIAANRNYLIRIPVDEPVLAIDANKRSIDTTLFTKCVNVQSDQIAETVIFSIDRYYDYMDLKNTSIWVQWTAPGEDGKMREGATEITLIDVETEPGKVRFGWPLDADITKVPGKVQFSVRFFIKKDVEVPNLSGGVDVVNKVVYSFNTLPATLTIQNALQPALNEATSVNKPDGLFAYAIRNSLYSGKDTKVPQTPSFSAPGQDLPTEATLVDDTLTLMAQAVVGDTSNIAYRWTYTSATDGEGEKDAAEHGTVGIAYRKSIAEKRVVSDDYYSAATVTADSEERKDVYYSHVDNDKVFVEAFEPYRGEVKTVELDDGSILTVTESGLPLYEKYSTFTVPAEGPVTGTYVCYAVGNNGFIDGEEQPSYPCKLVSPSEIDVAKPLAKSVVMVIPEGAEEGTPASANLVVEVVKAANDNSAYTYKWLKGNTQTDTLTAVSEDYIPENEFTVTTPGWYTTYIHSHLNRQTNEFKTAHRCKVTFEPAVPTVSFDTAAMDDSDADTCFIVEPAGNEISLKLNASVANATTYNKDDLYSEGLTYTWTYRVNDGAEDVPVTAADIVGGDISSNEIKIVVSENIRLYKCAVTNTLNGKTAVFPAEFSIVATAAN